MRKTPIKIPRPFRQNQFAIPLVKGADEREAMKDFGQYGKLLEKWGFQRLAHARSVSHASLAQGALRSSSQERLEDYELWHHPAGVLARLHSYSTPSYVRADGTVEPARHALSSIWLDAKVDTGMGPEIQHRSAVDIRGSGGSTPTLDGRFIRSISETVHGNTQTSLYGFMEMIQRHGRLLAFDRWNEDPDRVSAVHITPEIIVPLHSWPREEPFAIEDMHAKTLAFVERLPPPIAALFREQELLGAKRQAAPRSGPRYGPSWDPVEFGIGQFSEAMFLANRRWPTAQERALLAHWHGVALGKCGEDPDPLAMRAYEQGPAGLSLPVALIYAKRSATAAPVILEKLLRSAPLDILHRWATQPDAAGYTLALRAVHRSFTERLIDTHDPLDVDVLGILHERLGPEGLVMSTPTRSVMGIALQAQPDEDGREADIRLRQHTEFAQAIARLDDWDVDWGSNLRWRNYPNLYRDKDKPTFFQVDGPVDPGQWKDLMGINYTAALDLVASRLQHQRMRNATPKPRPAGAPPPRL